MLWRFVHEFFDYHASLATLEFHCIASSLFVTGVKQEAEGRIDQYMIAQRSTLGAVDTGPDYMALQINCQSLESSQWQG